MKDCEVCLNHKTCRLKHKDKTEKCVFVYPLPIIHSKEELEEHDKRVRNKAIDEFAERIIERLKGMQMAELQGEDVCPYGDTLEECPYINAELGCQYCAREQTIKDIDAIAEQMKGK